MSRWSRGDGALCLGVALTGRRYPLNAIHPLVVQSDGKPILQVDVHPAAIYAIAAIQELHGLLKAKNEDLAKLKDQNTALEKRLQSLEKVVSGLAR